MLTNQEIFDKSVGGLLAQNATAVDAHGSCVLKTQGGLRCAVGQLIDESVYVPNMEYTDIPELFTTYASEMIEMGLDSGNEGVVMLLEDLQAIHDRNPVTEWPQLYSILASQFGLNDNVITEFLTP